MQSFFKKRWVWLCSLLVIALVVIPLAVFADQVTNNLDADVDIAVEALALNYPGVAKTVKIYVNPANGDGRTGCNITSGTTFGSLSISIASSNTNRPL